MDRATIHRIVSAYAPPVDMSEVEALVKGDALVIVAECPMCTSPETGRGFQSVLVMEDDGHDLYEVSMTCPSCGHKWAH